MASQTMRPRVGITCDHEYLRDSRGSQVGRHYASERYAQAVYAAGGEPYLLPHRKELDAAGAQALLAPMQGLVISGGHFDIDPAYYGQEPHPLCGPLAQDRTHFEAALVTAAWRHKMPLLGICGGMQLMVVLAQGTLHQDLSLRPHTHVHEQPNPKSEGFHRVRLAPGSHIAHLMQTSTLHVNSTHHQVVDDVGWLQAVAWADDGVIEAVAGNAGPFCLGVQWHPEAMDDVLQGRIYTGFIEAI